MWAADITYLLMARGFLYLVAIMDWHSRYVVAWRLSNTLDAGFRAGAQEEALGKGQPEVFDTDQSLPRRRPEEASSRVGSSPQVLVNRGVRISMDREGAVLRQYLLGAAAADGEVRGGVPEGLRQRPQGPEGAGELLPVLQ